MHVLFSSYFPLLKACITEDISHLSSILCNLSTVQNITSTIHSSECLHLQFLLVCVWASVWGIYLVSTAIKGERKGFWRKGSCIFFRVWRWVNRSCCHEWKTACGLLFGIEFQLLPALLISSQKAKRAIITPSHRSFSHRHDGWNQ